MTYHPDATDDDKGKPVEIDFTPPFRRIAMLSDLQKTLGVTFPDFDLASPGIYASSFLSNSPALSFI